MTNRDPRTDPRDGDTIRRKGIEMSVHPCHATGLVFLRIGGYWAKAFKPKWYRWFAESAETTNSESIA